MDADVCVVGAGYAGLIAARRLQQAGATAIVLEARDRVAGRVWTRPAPDGTPIDIGGTWLGPGQDHAYALAAELGVTTYPTWNEGETVFAGRDAVKRFGGLVPPINPIALASLSLGMARLDAMAKRVPLDEPWTARRAKAWDARSAAQWIDTATVPARDGQGLLAAAVRGLFNCDPAEVSLLHVLYLIRSANGLNHLLSVEGGYQQDRVTGGAQTMADRVAAELGDALLLERPVREITQDGDGVVVRGDGVEVRARRVIVAIPPTLSGHLTYEPQLPVDRALLVQSMPAGSILKVSVMYDEPFWRTDGPQRPVGRDRVADRDDVGRLAALGCSRRARRVRLRPVCAHARRARSRRATPLRARRARDPVRAARRATGPLRGDRLGRGAVDARLFHGAHAAGRPHPVRAGAAGARRADPLGRQRDGHRVARQHRWRDPVG